MHKLGDQFKLQNACFFYARNGCRCRCACRLRSLVGRSIFFHRIFRTEFRKFPTSEAYQNKETKILITCTIRTRTRAARKTVLSEIFSFSPVISPYGRTKMPTNLYRVQGPEATVPYQQYLIGKNHERLGEIGTSLMKDVRCDGRDLNTHRNLCTVLTIILWNTAVLIIFQCYSCQGVKTGIVTQAKGSAYVECGHTKLVCSVFDPKEVPNKVEYAKTGELQCEFKFATFSCRQRRAYTRDSEERQLCNEFRRALEPAICRVSLC